MALGRSNPAGRIPGETRFGFEIDVFLFFSRTKTKTNAIGFERDVFVGSFAKGNNKSMHSALKLFFSLSLCEKEQQINAFDFENDMFLFLVRKK
jgi:hypothetical protein